MTVESILASIEFSIGPDRIRSNEFEVGRGFKCNSVSHIAIQGTEKFFVKAMSPPRIMELLLTWLEQRIIGFQDEEIRCDDGVYIMICICSFCNGSII
eukprot:scaffold8536_cov36-Cyclotella_meneghiniana.AAC.4